MALFTHTFAFVVADGCFANLSKFGPHQLSACASWPIISLCVAAEWHDRPRDSQMFGRPAAGAAPMPEAGFSIYEMTCGQAAVIIFTNCLIAKMIVTTFLRVPNIVRVGAGPADLGFTAATEKAKRIEAGTRAAAFVAVRAAQLNEAEYAGPLIAVLLYLHSKNIAAPIGSFLVAFGAILHFWAQVLLRTRAAQPLGAVPRYVGMGCLLYALSGAI